MKWTTICLTVLFSVLTIQGLDDPYKVLGVTRSATITEIRKAYKQLAKEWHPDKNSDPEAESKFVAVNQAYELLSDPERRKQFDLFGRIDDSPRPSKQPNFDTFDDLFTSSGFRFHFADRDITLFHKLSITTRAYENMLVPKSYRTPYLLLFYSDWCFACLQVEPVWRRIMEEVEPIGVGIATVHAENEKSLTKKVGAHSLPCLALLIDGTTYLYKESLFSVQKVVEFVRNKLPKLVTWINNEDNAEKFLAGWPDNKVRALVFQRSQPLRLRYLLAAFFHRERIAFGFIVGNPTLRSRYGLRGEQDAMLLFNELVERPVASLSMADIPVQTMHDVIYNNYYLILPRLSSQSLLDALCPIGVRRRLCVVLVCQDTAAHDPHRQAMRRFAAESSYSKERVRFMYIFEERQPQFISALSEGGKEMDGVQIAILARRDSSHIKYEWLSDPADQKDEASSVWLTYNSTKHFLETSIDRLLHPNTALSKEACVGELVDEASQGTVSRLLSKLLLSLEYLQDNLAKEHVLTALSIIVTLAVILLAAYFMHYLMKLEEAKVEEEAKRKGPNLGGVNGLQPQLKIHELRAETYNALVRLLKPGCRSIVLLVDNDSKAQLLPKFYRVVWPYRRNKTLLFAILCLDKRGVAWYTDVLAQSLPEPRKLTINPRNCVGTVLALNGLRKYFCMYHAKHPEGSLRPHTRMTKVVSKQSGVGSFIGFTDSTSESDLSDADIETGNSRQNLVTDKAGQEVLFMEHLLDGLPNWLDRLFEGTTQRYHLTYWPDYPTK